MIREKIARRKKSLSQSEEDKRLCLNLGSLVDPRHSAMLVIDMQNDFCSKRGSAYKRGRDIGEIQSMIPKLKTYLNKARGARIAVFFIKTEREDADISAPMLELMRRQGRQSYNCRRGTWGADLIRSIKPVNGEKIIIKKRYSAFYETDLEQKLKKANVSTVILTGVATNVCVDTTARDAFMRGFHVVLLKDLVATFDSSLQDATLRNLENYFGAVIFSDELVKAWGDALGS